MTQEAFPPIRIELGLRVGDGTIPLREHPIDEAGVWHGYAWYSEPSARHREHEARFRAEGDTWWAELHRALGDLREAIELAPPICRSDDGWVLDEAGHPIECFAVTHQEKAAAWGTAPAQRVFHYLAYEAQVTHIWAEEMKHRAYRSDHNVPSDATIDGEPYFEALAAVALRSQG